MTKKLHLFFVLILCTSALSANTNPLANFFDYFSNAKEANVISSKYSYAAPFNLPAPTITAIRNGPWRSTNTWSGGRIPTLRDNVLIPAGRNIVLNGNANARTITINGILRGINTRANNAQIRLKAEWILVSGANSRFEIGTAPRRYIGTGGCIITLAGNDDGDDIMNMGDKFLASMNGGTIELHGEQKISWTHLGANVAKDANRITLANAVDWNVNDEIVIVSSRTNWNEAEKRKITAISPNRRTITLNQKLNFPHNGTSKTYTRAKDNKKWQANLRAEVGLLTHNIKVQGQTTDALGFGGHIMAMNNSTLNATSIELYKMGQLSKLGRYPWHWHMMGDTGAGQFLKNSSVHKSFNRAVTIHGTNSTIVDNNFIYDHIGHGVFLEDGSERFNTISRNVALLTKRPGKNPVTPSDNQLNDPQNRTPATFWITNPNNTFRNNVAAGTQGTGFWFAFPEKPMGLSTNDPRFKNIRPFKEPLGLFRANKAHSCMSGFDVFDKLSPDHAIIANGGWQNDTQHLIENCTWYSNSLGVYTGIGGDAGDKVRYTGNLIFQNNILVDNVTAIQFASNSQVRQSVIVANSKTGIFNGKANLYRIYDGPGQIRNCHLVGWSENNAGLLKGGGAGLKHTNHSFSGITTDSNKLPNIVSANYDRKILNNNTTPQNLSLPRNWIVSLLDEDGSFLGVRNSSVVSNHPFMLIGDEFKPANWVNAYRSTHKFALSIIRYPGIEFSATPNTTCTRTKPNTPKESVYDAYGFKGPSQLPFIVNEGFQYTYDFESLPSTKNFTLTMDDAKIGDDYIIKLNRLGRLGGLSLKIRNVDIPKVNTMQLLRRATVSSYYVQANGSVFLKFIATNLTQNVAVKWNTSFTLPRLDTDGDSVSDRDEIKNGTDPFLASSNKSAVTKTLSTEEDVLFNNNEIKLYPNPANDILHFSGKYFDSDTNIQVIDLLGKIVLEKNMRASSDKDIKTVDISRLSKGLYMVIMNNRNKTVVKKIAVK